MKKWIITDLDGTLLDHKDNRVFVTKRASQAISNINSKTNYFTIATGRHYRDVLGLIRQFNIFFNGDFFIIGMNGNQIYSTKEKRLVHNNYLTMQELTDFDAILQYCEQKISNQYLIFGYCGDNEMFFIKNNSDDFDEMVTYMSEYESNEKTFDYKTYSDYREINKMYKICFYIIKKDINMDQLIKDLEKINPNLTYVCTGEYFFEIVNKGVSKQQAIEFINKNFYTDVSAEDTIVFGDSGNDYLMMKAAGLAITNTNAREQIKKIADIIYDIKESDFVAEGIDEYKNK